MAEFKIIILLTIGVFLWGIGGTFWRPAKVVVLPLLTGILLMSFLGWLTALTMGVANSLPYGDKTPWPLKLVVFFAIGLSGIWFDHYFGLWYALGTMVVLTAVELLSRRYGRVTHKVWEALAGFLQTTGVVLAVLR